MRPATPLICEFIDEHARTFGVVPICRALAVHGVQIAPRTYWAHRASAPSKRALWDTTITEILAGYYEPDADGKRPPESLYGSLKMWAHLQRQGIPVARRTVERIMRHNGWRGVTRARRVPRTTEPDPAAARAPDLVGRQWRVAAPNLLVVADFTYVPIDGRGFGYTAFVVDAYAGADPRLGVFAASRTPASSSVRCATPWPSAPAKATHSTTQSIIPTPEVSTPQYITARR